MPSLLAFVVLFLVVVSGCLVAIVIARLIQDAVNRRAAKQTAARAELVRQRQAERVVPVWERVDKVLNKRPRLVVNNDGGEGPGGDAA